MDGPATPYLASTLGSLGGLATDGQGHLFIADTYNSRIRRIDAAGRVTTVAGTGVNGFQDGPALTAEVSPSGGIAVDRDGTIYFSDSSERIRKVDLCGEVSTVAGNGSHPTDGTVIDGQGSGGADGGGTAEFFGLRSLALDASGTLYAVDAQDFAIRRVQPGGEVSTLTQLPSAFLAGLAVDPAGSALYFTQGNQVWMIALADGGVVPAPDGGVATAIAGTGVPGASNSTWLQSTFAGPVGIALDAVGDIYVVEETNNDVRELVTDGGVITLAGDGSSGYVDGTASTARFSSPDGLAIDAVSSEVYVGDEDNVRVRAIAGGEVTTLAGNGTPGFTDGSGEVGADGGAEIAGPAGMAMGSDGDLYVADYGNRAIRRIAPDGTVSTWITGLQGPWGIAFDAVGNLVVADLVIDGVLAFDPDGGPLWAVGGPGFGYQDTALPDGGSVPALFDYPVAVAPDGRGDVFVADEGNCLIREILVDGGVITYAGDVNRLRQHNCSQESGLGVGGTINAAAVALDAAGNVYTDSIFCGVLRISADGGDVELFAGGAPSVVFGVQCTLEDGGPSEVGDLVGLSFDSQGNLLAADTLYNAIRSVAPDGTVSTLAGNPTYSFGEQRAGMVNGPAMQAEFSNPLAVVAGPDGGVYVADFTYNCVRVITP